MASRGNIFLYIMQWIIALSTLAGWIYSLFSGAHELFGVITMAPFDWYLIFQACIIVIIFINRTRIVRLYKRATGQAEREKREAERERKDKEKEEKLQKLLSLIKEGRKLLILKAEKGEKGLDFSTLTQITQINLKLELRLIDLGFLVPNQEEKTRKNFDGMWYSFLSTLEVSIEERDYRVLPHIWVIMRQILQNPENPY